jgi:tetratricopeptide (TPR) repeat protein
MWVLFLLTLVSASAVDSTESLWDQHSSRGSTLERQGQHTAAEREFAAALPLAETLGPDNWRLPLTLHNLGSVMRELGRYPESERYYRRAISIWEVHLPRRQVELAGTLQNLGALDLMWGRYSRAELNYRRAYELRLNALGPSHPQVAASLHGLAELATARRRYPEAEELYRRATPILEAAYGADSLTVADIFHNLGVLYSEMHRDAEARTRLERAAAIYDQTVPSHPNLATILYNLAELDLKAGDLARAGERLERAMRICETSLPPDHQETAIVLAAYGRFLSQTHHKKEAKLASERARAILSQTARERGYAYTFDASAFTRDR